MDFAEGHIYHVYNRGNNSQTVFFTHENYLFFLEKLRKYILQHADVLAWCLMPNHFHLMIAVKQVEVEIVEQATAGGVSEQVTQSRLSEGFTQSEALTSFDRLSKLFAKFILLKNINF